MEKETILKKIISARRYKNIAFSVVVISSLIVSILTIYLEVRSVDEFVIDVKSLVLFVISLGGLILIMLTYLQGYWKNKVDNTINTNIINERSNIELNYLVREQSERIKLDFHELYLKISKKLDEYGQPNSIELTDNDKSKLLNIIEVKIEKIISDKVISSFEENYSKSSFLRNSYQDILIDLNNIQDRLINEISKLSLRANLNLAIGSATTIMAIIILYATVANNSFTFDSFPSALSFFIPRLSIVIFIEVFSFFFLKLYKTNLNDIKYYQNEMTNSEFKVLALKSAFAKDDLESIKKVIGEFAVTERNFLLKKGESTVELEKAKIDLKVDNSWKEIIKESIRLNNK